MKRAPVKCAVAVRRSVLSALLLDDPRKQSFVFPATTMVCSSYLLLREARQYLDNGEL